MQFRFYSSLWSCSVPSKTPEKTKKKKQSYEPIISLRQSPLWNPQWEHLLSSTNQRETQSKINEKIKGRKHQAPFYLEGDDELFPDCSCCKWGKKQHNSRHTSHPPPKKAFSISKVDNVETYKGVKSMQTWTGDGKEECKDVVVLVVVFLAPPSVRAGAGGGGLWREGEREREDGKERWVSLRLSFRVWASMRLTCSKLAFMDVKTLVKVPVIRLQHGWNVTKLINRTL
jgi:hypothetical protein